MFIIDHNKRQTGDAFTSYIKEFLQVRKSRLFLYFNFCFLVSYLLLIVFFSSGRLPVSSGFRFTIYDTKTYYSSYHFKTLNDILTI